MKVLVTHPGRQHSHQAALALAQAGALAGYWSGVPAVARHFARVPAPLVRRFLRYAPVPLPPERVRWFPWSPLLRRAGEALLPRGTAYRVDYLACRGFDRWAARGLARLAADPATRPDAVLACEISALSTFRTAKRLGISTLLDAPSLHHTAQDRLHGFAEPGTLHRRIVATKDAEIELADHILTVSELARQTYLDGGALPEGVYALTLGADLELFVPREAPKPTGAPCVFLFAGAQIRRKGFDLLVEAFLRTRTSHPTAELRVVGPAGDASAALDRFGRAAITLLGSLPQAELAHELRNADCLVLPSRNDSFAMVVAEALASGIPAIVSEMVGAQVLLRAGETGWIVPIEDVSALATRMSACAANPTALRRLGPACRAAAAAATWPAYHQRFVALLAELLR
jgi:glycosyltransferase involved in cell wall biosynthesis